MKQKVEVTYKFKSFIMGSYPIKCSYCYSWPDSFLGKGKKEVFTHKLDKGRLSQGSIKGSSTDRHNYCTS